ncbi:MAG: thiamine phosphate synthase [Planctomycetes bacterium]|nr:thiamine phosphate synthase [Planctomycetota bacterium]
MGEADRAIDASANRASEGLRTLEDAMRFGLGRGDLVERCKAVRHGLRSALDRLPPGRAVAHRDATSDAGREVRGEREGDRDGVRGVALAGMRRAIEALRSLEEFGKLVEPGFSAACASLRYAAYDLERDAVLAFGSPRRFQPRLCLLLTESICRRPWRDALRAALDGGTDMVQVREKSMDASDLLRRAREVIEVARPRGVTVVVNDRADIAVAAGADGVHLGTGDLPLMEARRLAGTGLLLGASTHDLGEASAAVEAGADLCGVGAMFASGLKPDRVPSGAAYLRAFVERFPRTPHLAIGGITAENVGRLVEAGAQGVAVSSAICGAADPAAAASALRSRLPGAATVPSP